jgi:hypothetical protein
LKIVDLEGALRKFTTICVQPEEDYSGLDSQQLEHQISEHKLLTLEKEKELLSL